MLDYGARLPSGTVIVKLVRLRIFAVAIVELARTTEINLSKPSVQLNRFPLERRAAAPRAAASEQEEPESIEHRSPM